MRGFPQEDVELEPLWVLPVLLFLVLYGYFCHPTQGSARRQNADAEFLSEDVVESIAGHGSNGLPHRTVPLDPPPHPFESGTYAGTYGHPKAKEAPEYQRSVVDPYDLPPFQMRFLPLTRHIPGQITIEGEGTDGVGRYHITGRYALNPFRVVLTKHYGVRGEYLVFTHGTTGAIDTDAEGRTEGYYLAENGECRWSRGGGGMGRRNPHRDMFNVSHRDHTSPFEGPTTFNLHDVHIRLRETVEEDTGNVMLRGKYITGSNDEYGSGGDITIWRVST
mmetsp:Transcript_30475/g.89104  ORF Transcript_30475/g.89104 Transcript_30475/m.89104 type:complete len:277 (-) Transcript_30475:1586-2416(-)